MTRNIQDVLGQGERLDRECWLVGLHWTFLVVCAAVIECYCDLCVTIGVCLCPLRASHTAS